METIRAAVEVIVPPTEDSPGGADLGVQDHVTEVLDRLSPGFVDLAATLLDAYAVDVRPGVAFRDLTLEEKGRVLKDISRESSQDLIDVVSGLLVFAYGGMYSEWTGYDRASKTLEPPSVWERMGYQGPVSGHPKYREDV